jgi:hypothetical protein
MPERPKARGRFGLPEGWLLCVLEPKTTYGMVKRQERMIDQLRVQLTARTYELMWCHSEIGDLIRTLGLLRAAKACNESYIERVQAGEEHDEAADAARRAYDLTLWLERSAQENWQERRHAWVNETLAKVETQRRELEDA